MTGPDAIREIAQTARDHVRNGMASTAISPCQGWTVIATSGGVRFATPHGVFVLTDAWIGGADDPMLADVLALVEVVA